jgi:DNA (cytosine-5)-methyltransferase 1
VRFDADFRDGVLTYTRNAEGKRKVAGTPERPIIDTNTPKIGASLGVSGGDRVTVRISEGRITVRATYASEAREGGVEYKGVRATQLQVSTAEVAVRQVFSGRREGNVEVHLTREDLKDIIVGALVLHAKGEDAGLVREAPAPYGENQVTAVDLFAGAGGFSTGARAAGLRVLWAANHWQDAVDIHAANHPRTAHACQDLHQADWRDVPAMDVVLASPACQGHSKARGKERAHHDATRSTAWAVVSCVEYHRPQAVVVENVKEFLNWALYPAWEQAMQALGYRLNPMVIDSADAGVPQHRERLFIVCGLERHLDIPQPAAAHAPVADIIDWESGSWSPVIKPKNAARPRAQATIDRWRAGRAEQGKRFVMPYYGNGSGKTGRSLDRPIGTVTTRDRWALVDDKRMRMLTPSHPHRQPALGARPRQLPPARGVHPHGRLRGRAGHRGRRQGVRRRAPLRRDVPRAALRLRPAPPRRPGRRGGVLPPEQQQGHHQPLPRPRPPGGRRARALRPAGRGPRQRRDMVPRPMLRAAARGAGAAQVGRRARVARCARRRELQRPGAAAQPERRRRLRRPPRHHLPSLQRRLPGPRHAAHPAAHRRP